MPMTIRVKGHTRDYLFCRPPTPSRSHDHTHSHAVSMVQWYPHDTGLFTTSSANHTLQVWDTNLLVMVDKFKFSGITYAHSMAASESHSLIAGIG